MTKQEQWQARCESNKANNVRWIDLSEEVRQEERTMRNAGAMEFAKSINFYPLLQNVSDNTGVLLHESIEANKQGFPVIRIKSNELDLENIGIMSKCIESITLETFNTCVVALVDDDENRNETGKFRYACSLDFHYRHHGGGENVSNVLSAWYEDGRWQLRCVEEPDVTFFIDDMGNTVIED